VLDDVLSSFEGAGDEKDTSKPSKEEKGREGGEAPSQSPVEIPEKFKTKDGKVNIEALTKSYIELEKELTRKSQELSQYKELLNNLLKEQQKTQQPSAQIEEKKEEESEEDLAELLLSEPKKAIEKIRSELEKELINKVSTQTIQMLYQSIPPEERIARVVANSVQLLSEEDKEKVNKNREKYEKVYDALMKRLGPERIETHLASYAQAGLPPAKFFIDIADAIEEAIRAKETAIREAEKATSSPASSAKSSPPPEQKPAENLDKLADDVIKELGLVD